MEQTTIINELRKFEVDGERYNGMVGMEVANYRNYLEDALNLFFDDLSLFMANKDKGIVSDYISLTLSNLERGEKQLETRYQAYCQEHKGEDWQLMDTAVALQKEFTRQMRHRLEDVLTGKNPEERKAVIRKDELDKEAYNELLSEYGDLLSINDLTKIFGVSRQTIYNWEQEGKIHHSDVQGRKPRYLKSDIKAYIMYNRPDLERELLHRNG